MSRSRRDREEELLRRIIETDGIKKIQDTITAVISSGTINVEQPDQTRLKATVFQTDGEQLRSRIVGEVALVPVVNSDFEDGLTGWFTTGTVEEESTTVYSGLKSARMKPGSYLRQVFSKKIPTDWLIRNRLMFYLGGNPAGNQYIYFKIYYDDGTSTTSSEAVTPPMGFAWREFIASYTAAKYVVMIEIQCPSGNVEDVIVDTVNWFMREQIYVTDIGDDATRELGIVTAKLNFPSIENLGRVMNGDFETGDLTNWVRLATSSNALVSSTYKFRGLYSCQLKYEAPGKGIFQFFTTPLNVDILTVFNIMAMVRENFSVLTAVIYYTDNTTQTLTFTPVGLATWELFNMLPSLTAGKFVSGIHYYNSGGVASATDLFIDAFCAKEAVELKKIAGTPLTGRNWSLDFAYLQLLYGNGIWAEFNKTITRDADGRISVIEISDNIDGKTKIISITRDANGRITDISEAVS